MLIKANEIHTKLIDWRRDFHAHPELGFQEVRTAFIVAKELEALGFRVRTGVGRTGVVADIGNGEPIVAIRADMDALPVRETNDVPYASRTPGVMHACGHDAHTAIGLGVATVLTRSSFKGTIRLVFQPAEEIEDENGLSGAHYMFKEGALDGVRAIIALHVDSSLPAGEISIKPGTVSAGVDNFYGVVKGKGAHAAEPHKGVDPFLITGHVIFGLHSIVSRRLPPLAPAVVSIGTIHGGEAENVIPERVDITGTMRYVEADLQAQLHAEIELVFEAARVMGGDYELELVCSCPPVVNDESIINTIQATAIDLLGADRVRPGGQSMGAEDFAVFSG
ncbi:MAG: amidohydrolase, partial [Anaerolineales bacterium]|nr:amidohydrolase [Anaerolineales bacterium]